MRSVPGDHLDAHGDAGMAPFKLGHHGCDAFSLLAEGPEDNFGPRDSMRSASGAAQQNQSDAQYRDETHGARDAVPVPRTFGGAARLHQENTGNAGRGFGIGTQAPDGVDAMSKKHMGSSIDDFLKEEGVFEEAQAQAVKEVVAWQTRPGHEGKENIEEPHGHAAQDKPHAG
jgi:hypothetical protein